ncbi:MAG: insulinase family protein [Candidatus Latescibacteria bacterium]|nr:insulinase family protein [Candidatus Latescibacterota bacterium]
MHDFELLRDEHISELNTQALHYRHRTGCELVSLINDDENKVFGITFRTPPSDSTGIAHILEHAVLCGSRKYPVKEPFVELIKGSLNTFLNAFTYPDKTCYPVASTNLRDFYNLIDVYLDAVFYPRITPEVLQQEGWHYELTDATDSLSYSGVVFNEMKGAYSDPERVLAEHAQHSIFPDNTYGVDSGGNPRHIPDLTFEQFKRFHADYYQAANARVFFYGDDDPEQRLTLLEEYLGDYQPHTVDSAVGPQRRFAAPQRLDYSYAVDGAEGDEPKAFVALNWLLADDIDIDERRALQILDYALIGTPGSPLRKALIDAGLGEDLTGSGIETDLAQLCFGIGLKGVAAADVDKVEALVLQLLGGLATEGIERGMVDAALHTAEFRLRENNTGAYPRGLVLMLRVLTDWLHDRDPFAPLCFEVSFAALKQELAADGRHMEGLIQRHLLDNVHRTTVVLSPDADLAARQEREEEARLAAARAEMGPAELDRLVAATAELKRLQERPDDPADLAKLPRLELGDLEREIKSIPIEAAQVAEVPVLHHDLFTNGIAYLDIGFDLRVLPQELLPYVPLFGRSLLELGTRRESFVDLQQRIGAQTGGVWTQSLLSSRRDGGPAATWLFLRGKAMVDRVDELTRIARDVLLEGRVDDRARFLQMALEERAGEESGLVPGGHRVVVSRLRSQFDETGWLSEQMRGLDYLFFLRRLIDEIESDWPAVQARLQQIRELLVNRRGMLINATLAGVDRGAVERSLEGLVAELPEGERATQIWSPEFSATDEGLTAPAQVNYVGKAANLFDLGYELDGSSAVITRYLATTWLWDRVRVQGGAYGAFCSFDPFTGVLAYVSYRDPNVQETLAIYDGSGGFLRDNPITADELTKAIIGTIGDFDAYQLPDAKGYTSMVRHLTGIDDDYRQQMRDQVLGTASQSFTAFADMLDEVKDRGRVVVLGGAEAVAGAGLEAIKIL